jgi:festuclavine dehydrogenase
MASQSPILLLGGTGKVATRIVSRLHGAGVTVLTASRSGKPPLDALGVNGVNFDWLDEETYINPFEHSTAAAGGGIRAIFVVAPPILDMAPPMKAFIQIARERGVRRFVLLSSSALEAGGPGMGLIHAHLQETAAQEDGRATVEWAALRPSWFMGV